MNNKQILFLTLGMIAVFGLLYGVYVLIGAGPDEALIKKIRTEKPVERTLWNREAPHTLTVFSDFQCPACKVFHDALSTVTASSSPDVATSKKVAYVFRYFPLYQIHAHAFSLAYAAEAAARQGKFEDIAKRFFADQAKLEGMKDLNPYLSEVVRDLNLDMKKFTADMNDKKLQNLIQEDLSVGEKMRVNATPTFFLDGVQLESMAPVALLKQLKDLK